ncbi:MAG: MFS transporter [Acidimicrobiales bacterium]
MTAAPVADPTRPIDVEALQRRSVAVLSLSSVAGRASMSAAFTVAALALTDMWDTVAWAGLSTVAITIGTAASSAWLSKLMDKAGRRFGFLAGFAVAAAGTIGAAAALVAGSIPAFLAGLAAVGIGQAATNLCRYGATDLAAPGTASRAISIVVFASAFGAAAGPLIVGPTSGIGADRGWSEYVGPFLGGAVFYGVAALIVALLLRPDPLLTARSLALTTGPSTAPSPTAATASTTGPPPQRALAALVATSPGALGLGGLVISQAVMVMVMSMTPLHMDAHGHGGGVIGQVISLHTVGMFAFAPLAGWAADRFGCERMIAVGAAVLAAATAITALAGEAPAILMFPGLFLLGLGWSFAMVASSSLINSSVSEQHRVGAQGAADVATSITSGAAALAAGHVFAMEGFHVLSMIGILTSGALLTWAFTLVAQSRAGLRSGDPSSR